MENEDVHFNEILIDHVKKCPLLYDMTHPEYKNAKLKNKHWNEIAKIINLNGMDGYSLKKKWKNIRDNYAKYLRSQNADTAHLEPKSVCRYKTWPWAPQMEPIRPFIGFTKTQHNLSTAGTAPPQDGADVEDNLEQEVIQSVIIAQDCNLIDGTLIDGNLIDENLADGNIINGNITDGNHKQVIETRFLSGVPNRRRKMKNVVLKTSAKTSSVDKMLNILEHICDDDMDEVDKIFQGYAAAVKKLTPRRQTMVKFKIAKLIMEAELEQQMEMET